MAEPTSLERLLEARETLTALLGESLTGDDGFPGARDADAFGAFVEAKRNLTAFCGWKYGDAALEAALAQDGER